MRIKIDDQFILNQHFWRGFVDGDGSLGINARGYVFFNLCGTWNTCCGLLNYLRSKDKIFNRYCVRTIKSKRSYELQLGCKSAKKAILYLYSDANIYLDRKYKRYQKICV